MASSSRLIDYKTIVHLSINILSEHLNELSEGLTKQEHTNFFDALVSADTQEVAQLIHIITCTANDMGEPIKCDKKISEEAVFNTLMQQKKKWLAKKEKVSDAQQYTLSPQSHIQALQKRFI